MSKRKYSAPVIFTVNPGGSGSVIGEGSGQGTIAPDGMTYEEWWEEIAWEGENPDADYNGDGEVDYDDWLYYLEHELWDGGD